MYERVYSESLQTRWENALSTNASSGASWPLVEDLRGTWRVQRLSGIVPMKGLYKVIGGNRGATGATWSPFPDFGFSLEQLDSSVLLVYDRPLGFMQDELRKETECCWLGRARLAGRQYAWFRMVPYESAGS